MTTTDFRHATALDSKPARRRLRLTPAIAALGMVLCALPARATVFKCIGPSGATFQQTPCRSGSEQSTVSVRPSAGTRTAADQGPAPQKSARPADVGQALRAVMEQRRAEAMRRVSVAGRAQPTDGIAAGAAGSTAPAPHEAPTAQPGEPLTAARPPAGCKFPWVDLPREVVVLAAAGSGMWKPSGFPIDNSGMEAQVVEVVVNQPQRPVALLLSFTSSTIWRIRWTAGTQIVAVWASGSDRQAVAGLPASTPLLETDRATPSPCGDFGYFGSTFNGANAISRMAFGRPVMEAFTRHSLEAIWIGPPPAPGQVLQSSSDRPVGSLEFAAGWANGTVGIKRLLREGALRPALRRELDAWHAAWLTAQGAPPVDNPSRHGNPNDKLGDQVLVVQRPFEFPKGLHGAHARRFIIPQGMHTPTGEPGHSTVMDWNTLSCCGSYCPAKGESERVPACKAR